jgi:hypothetical protein
MDFEGQSVVLSEINILKMRATLKKKDDTQIHVPLDRIIPLDKLEQLRGTRTLGSCPDAADPGKETVGTAPGARDTAAGESPGGQAAGESQVQVG